MQSSTDYNYDYSTIFKTFDRDIDETRKTLTLFLHIIFLERGNLLWFSYSFLFLATYKTAETIAETPKTNIAKIKANKYVAGTYPTPLGSGILNINEIEMKYDSIDNTIGIII